MCGSGSTTTKPAPAPRRGRKLKEPSTSVTNCRMCGCCFGPTYWKTNFSLSSRKENLSPQEFALRVEQRLETAPGNCTAMLSQIREELNTPTDNEQLLRLKRMSKSPHSNPRLGDLAL